MKRSRKRAAANLTLFSLLLGLLTFTYFHEELPERRQSLEKERERPFSFLKMGGLTKKDLISIRIGTVLLIHKEGKFLVHSSFDPESVSLPADEKVVSDFLEKLSYICLERALLPKERMGLRKEHFFPDPDRWISFNFRQSSISYQLGEKLGLSGSFYLNLIKDGKENWLVAYDDGPGVEFMPEGKEDGRSSEKFLALRALFERKADFFVGKKVFADEEEMLAAGPRMSMDFASGRHHELTLVKSGEELQVRRGLGAVPVGMAFQQLFQLLTGKGDLGLFMEVQHLSAEEARKLAKESDHQVKIQWRPLTGKAMTLYIAVNNNKQQLLLINPQGKYYFRYRIRSNVSFPVTEKDYFESHILGN